MSLQYITDLLDTAAAKHADRSILIYPLGNLETPQVLTYSQLRHLAQKYGKALRKLDGFSERSIILLHFDDHWDNVVWFWSTLYAGCIPAMSTPFVNNPVHCEKHLSHLKEVMNDPVCLTRSKLRHQFPERAILRIQDADSLDVLCGPDVETNGSIGQPKSNSSDLALLMLTSGSTGNAKAVCLTYKQILASVAGKTSFLKMDNRLSFLNWVGLDHVASLVEIHLHAMFIGVDQIHVQSSDMIANPTIMLEMAHRHRIGRTFAPNFFLAKLRHCIENQDLDLDLSCLHYIVSGGEANVVKTCDALSKLLCQYGAPRNSIVPTFGMTETCAGAIYHMDCPAYDLDLHNEFTSVGDCIPGIEMRVSSFSGDGTLAKPGEPGNLEVSGPIVFCEYYNNKLATSEAFTADGWFKTGDIAITDSSGKINVTGRTKEMISLNAVKYLPHELEAAIEEANINGVTPSYIVCFSYRPQRAETEKLCVIYLPDYEPENVEARVHALNAITTTALLQTNTQPYVLPLADRFLEKTTLGKLSRTKIRKSLENGEYQSLEQKNTQILRAHSESIKTPPVNDTEQILLEEFQDVLGARNEEFGVETAVFEWGVTSIELIKLKKRTQDRLHREISIILMMTNTTVRALAKAVTDLDPKEEYNPVVTLNSHGKKTPLWLIHPGVGEILVFIGLSKFLTDRPVHALRARGFNVGETYFKDLEECITVYHAAIKRQQPHGPYAIAGYSFGAMVGFEIAKVLERKGDEVRFLGTFNLPPHIKHRIRQLDRVACLLQLAFFLDIISEEYAHSISPKMHSISYPDAVAHIASVAPPSRMVDLDLTVDKLGKWANLTYALQQTSINYEPAGKVQCMDIFYCNPVAVVAKNKEEWLAEHLSKWAEFSKETAFHEVDGSHYTMLGPDHLHTFQKKLKKVLSDRGL